MLGALLFLVSCGGPASPRPPSHPSTRIIKDHPPLALVERDGDPRGAVALAVVTTGVADERGAEVPVALAGLIETRLAARGLADITVVPSWDGYRVRALVRTEADVSRTLDALRETLLTPVDTTAGAAKKLEALTHRPLLAPALLDAARCTGDPFGRPGAFHPPTVAELEGWRRQAHGLGRVAFAAVGTVPLTDAAASSLAKSPVWPSATLPASIPWPSADAQAGIYDATGLIASGSARVTLLAYTPEPSLALLAAAGVGSERGALALRLGALDGPAKLRSVTAGVHPGGGCLAVVFDMAARDLAGDPSGRLATAAALARQELAVELGELASDAAAAQALLLRASDPREAAERAAWWTLASERSEKTERRFSLAIGLSTRGSQTPTAIQSDLHRAIVGWHAPVVQGRTRVERGQGDLWLLLASPCGTSGEVDTDAGVSATVAVAASDQVYRSGMEAEPWVASDGVGVMVHGSARPGETTLAHARRLADAVARPFAAEALEASTVARVHAALFSKAGEGEARLLVALAAGLGHAPWLSPFGTTEGLGRVSDGSVLLRASALRAGPLRVAVLANADGAQADAAVRAVDRWVARRPGENRACALPSGPTKVRPGTYAFDLPAGASSEVALAIPVERSARSLAEGMATVLDGGLLARALGPLVRSASARVVGAPQAPALVVRFTASDTSVDHAVAQTRVLFERLRTGALTETEVTLAVQRRNEADLRRSLDPRQRLVALWRDEATAPAWTLEALRAFCAAALREEALVIVAARPPRLSKGG
jgi:hypothetical protein